MMIISMMMDDNDGCDDDDDREWSTSASAYALRPSTASCAGSTS